MTPEPAGSAGGPDAGDVPTPTPTSVPGLMAGEADPAVPRRRHLVRRKRRLWLWMAFILVALAVVVASRWNLDYYALQPGTAQSVQQFITVPPAKNHPVTHPVLLTDVQIGRVTALSYLFFKLQSNSTLEQVESVTGGTPPSQLTAQGNLEMSQAEDDAKAAALTRLGYSVRATPSGAVIFGTFPGTPAYGVLEVGDVVTAVDGVAHSDGPSTHPRAVALPLRTERRADRAQRWVRCTGPGVHHPQVHRVDLGNGQTVRLELGIQPEDQVDYAYPFPVKIDVTDIGGPSAGLAMTLGVIDALTNGSVTGGHTVAATGTIDSVGDVGDVGGVAQKTVAVENAGATIFLVPRQEYKAALSKVRPGLQVYAVSTLDQALQVLAAHGGAVPPAPASPSPSVTPVTTPG